MRSGVWVPPVDGDTSIVVLDAVAGTVFGEMGYGWVRDGFG